MAESTAWTPSRRQILTTAAVGAAALALPTWSGSRAVAATAPGDPVLEDHGGSEPSDTHVRKVNGAAVLFAYGAVVPGFDGWRSHERTRSYAPLDGRWRFTFDPDVRGVRDRWFAAGYDDHRWRSAAVPSAWDLSDGGAFASTGGSAFGQGSAFTDGYAWYRRTVVLDRSWHDRFVRLHSLGIGYSAEVWVDGVFIGKHEGASGAFAMPIPARSGRAGRHVIAIRVFRRASYRDYASADAPVTDDLEIPYKPVDYWPYAGLTRSLWLEGVPDVSIAKTLVHEDDGNVILEAVIENRSSRTWSGTIRWAGLSRHTAAAPVRVPAKSTTVVAVRAGSAGLARWSPQDPAMHATSVSLLDRADHERDRSTARFGLRSVGVAGTSLQLDGRALFLKGLNWHEETAERGRALRPEDLDAELAHVTDLGAGMIRNSVYSRHPHVYDWADEHGVFVMEDLETMWLNTAQQRVQTERYGLSAAMAATAAWNHHDNPSVILWGLQNESEIDAGAAPVYRAWLQQMKDAIRAVDRHERPVTWASSTTNDPAFDLADVIGFNEYFGYFYGATADLGPTLDAVHAAHPGKPLLITENGAWAIAGTHGSAATQGTEEWQAEYLAAHWNQTVARRTFVAGYTAWVLKDYKERGGYNQDFNGISVMGVLAFNGTTTKLAYARFRDLGA